MSNLTIFDPIRMQMEGMAKRIGAVAVEDAVTSATAEIALKDARALMDGMEAARKAYVGPLNLLVKQCNAYCKAATAKLDEEYSRIKASLCEYEKKISLEREKKLDELDEKRALVAAREVGQESEWARLFEDKTALAEAQTRMQDIIERRQIEQERVKGARRVWKFEVVDKSLLPSDFLAADEKAISKAVREGVREIPGVKIYQDIVVAVGRP